MYYSENRLNYTSLNVREIKYIYLIILNGLIVPIQCKIRHNYEKQILKYEYFYI